MDSLLAMFTKGLPIEYQSSQRTKQYKGIPKDSRNTKGPKDQGIPKPEKEKRKEKRTQKVD
jgi:hypothetical protein